ncbi:MAG: DUF4921 family protein [Planctomycetaceae bacterium]
MADSSLRIDVLTGRQVIVAPHRGLRPGARNVDPILADPSRGNPFLHGKESETPGEKLALRRTDTRPNELGWLVRVVPNQYPVVFTDEDISTPTGNGLLRTMPVFGIHEVVIESPTPHRRLSELSAAETARVLLAWQLRVRDLERRPGIQSITVFRNEGFSAGASLPHVHSQILALNTISPQTTVRVQRSISHRRKFGTSLLNDLCKEELTAGRRIVSAESGCLVMCPFAGRVSWQVRIVPQRSARESFSRCSESDLINIAGVLHAATTAIDECAGKMAVNVLLVQPPVSDESDSWFLELMPRSARMAGYELATDVDIVAVAPESAADLLRAAFRHAAPRPTDVVPFGYEWR